MSSLDFLFLATCGKTKVRHSKATEAERRLARAGREYLKYAE